MDHSLVFMQASTQPILSDRSWAFSKLHFYTVISVKERWVKDHLVGYVITKEFDHKWKIKLI